MKQATGCFTATKRKAPEEQSLFRGFSNAFKQAASCRPILTTQAERFDYSTITIDVAVVEIIEQCAALSYQDGQ